jgi:hypothetical protein
MQTRSKLIALELTAGILGWIWIIASLAVVGLAIWAVFFEGSWWNVLWAFITPGVTKWLARGFDDSKKPVWYESELVKRGYTQQQAAQAWLAVYNGGEDLLAEVKSRENEQVN